MPGWLTWIKDTIGGVFESVMDKIQETFVSRILYALYEKIYDALGSLFSKINANSASLFRLRWVRGMLHFFGLFGLALCTAGVLVAVFRLVLDYQHMHGVNFRRQILPLILAFPAALSFTRIPVALYTFCTDLQGVFAKELVTLALGERLEVLDLLRGALMLFGTSSSEPVNPVVLIAGLLCLGYCVIRVFFSNLKRGAILLVQICTGSLHLFSLPSGPEGFLGWFRRVIALCFTTFMQNTLLLLGLATLHTNLLLGIGVLLASTEVPRIADQFGLESGSHLHLSQTLRTTSAAVHLGRALLH